MPTLTQPALSMLIDRLFAEADAAENERWPATRAGDREDYRQYYGLLKDQPLPVPHHRQASLHAGAGGSGAHYRRVRHVVRHFDAASGGSAPG